MRVYSDTFERSQWGFGIYCFVEGPLRQLVFAFLFRGIVVEWKYKK